MSSRLLYPSFTALQPDTTAAKVSRPIILASAGRQAVRREGIRMNAIDVVIMAAGQGTRMKSRLPKVLHRLAGRPLLQHVFDTVSQLQARHVVVVTGNGAAQVEAAVRGWSSSAGAPAPLFARQEPQ